MAFPTGWDHSAALVIQASQVDANQVDYPLLLTEVSLPLSMFDADGSAPALNGGGDIRFSLDSDGGTQLACEVVAFITDPDPSNGKAEIWVKVPSLSSSTNTNIFIWYGKADETQPAPSDTYGSENVWDSNFKGLWHLNQDPSGTAPQELDSTANNNDGTSYGSMTSDDLVDGEIAKALDFDGSDDSIDCGHGIPSLSLVLPITMSAWIYKVHGGGYNNGSGYDGIVVLDRTGTANYYGAFLTLSAISGATYKITIGYGDGSGAGSPNRRSFESSDYVISENKWTHVSMIVRGATDMSLFINGLEVSGAYSGTGGTMAWSSGGHTHIGLTSANFNYYFKGKIDEVRISNANRSAAWIRAGFNNQNDPVSFVAVIGSPEILSASIASNNIYVKLTFSRDVWGDASQSTTISKNDLEVLFSQNPNAGGLTTGAEIEDLYTSVALDTKLAAGTGYSEVYVKLILFGDSPAGVETIEFKPASASAIYGAYGNAMPITETSGVLTLNAAASVTLDWSSFDVAMFDLNSILSILLPSLFGHGLHVFFTDKSLFQQVKADLYSKISSLPVGDQSLAIDLLNFFQRFYGK